MQKCSKKLILIQRSTIISIHDFWQFRVSKKDAKRYGKLISLYENTIVDGDLVGENLTVVSSETDFAFQTKQTNDQFLPIRFPKKANFLNIGLRNDSFATSESF